MWRVNDFTLDSWFSFLKGGRTFLLVPGFSGLLFMAMIKTLLREERVYLAYKLCHQRKPRQEPGSRN